MTQSILIFDSGAGGLSIARCILAQALGIKVYYCADFAGFPYSALTSQTICERVCGLIPQALAQTQADLVVIACNTASTVSLEMLRKIVNVPVVGVVPAIKPAAKLTQSCSIGVLATPVTIKGRYLQTLIQEHAQGLHLVLQGSQRLVHLAERYVLEPELLEIHDAIQAQVAYDLQVLLKPTQGHLTIDTVVLACTHFPLLLDWFKEFANRKQLAIRFIDSGEAIAARVVHLLGLDLPASKNMYLGSWQAVVHNHEVLASPLLTLKAPDKHTLFENTVGNDAISMSLEQRINAYSRFLNSP